MNYRLIILTFLALTFFALFSSSVYAEYQRPVQNMSVEDINNERYGIQQHQKLLNLMRRTAEGIRDGACSSYWKGANRAKEELTQIPNSYSFKTKREQVTQRNKQYLSQYEQCFSQQLRRYPDIYNDELDPARSYKEFLAVYDTLAGKLNTLQARFYDLGKELKRREKG